MPSETPRISRYTSLVTPAAINKLMLSALPLIHRLMTLLGAEELFILCLHVAIEDLLDGPADLVLDLPGHLGLVQDDCGRIIFLGHGHLPIPNVWKQAVSRVLWPFDKTGNHTQYVTLPIRAATHITGIE